MNTKLIVGIVLAVVVIAMVTIGLKSGSDDTKTSASIQTEEYVGIRKDVKPTPNTFKIMTSEEKAAAEEAERLEAEMVAKASSTATSTATSTDKVEDAEG